MIDVLDLAFKFTQSLMDITDILATVSVFEVATFSLNVLFFLSNKND